MSTKLHEIVQAVNEEIAPRLPGMSSEKKRIEMRKNLLALEKMIKEYRKDLLTESKEIKLLRNKKKKKLHADINSNTSQEINGAETV